MLKKKYTLASKNTITRINYFHISNLFQVCHLAWPKKLTLQHKIQQLSYFYTNARSRAILGRKKSQDKSGVAIEKFKEYLKLIQGLE